MSSSAMRISGRVLCGIVAVAGAGALVLGASMLPSPALATSGAEVVPTSVDQVRVCPGPLLRLGDASGATAITATGTPAIAAGTMTAGAAVGGLADVDVAASEDGATSSVLAAPAAAAGDGLLAAAQAQGIADADSRGFAAISCTEGAASSWLLAGATDTGRSSILLLANPNPVAATVDLALFTGSGRVQAPGLEDIPIAPRSQRALSLAGFAPGQAQLAVLVRSKGGLVTAALEHTIVRGLEPGGVDLVGRTAAAATTQVIPGVRITTSDAAAARAQVGGSQDVETVVRVLSPQADATVSIGVVPESGDGAGTAVEAEVHAGEVVDVPLAVLADGNYTITVESPEPVLATARVSTVAPPDPDAEESDEEDSAPVILDGGGEGNGEVGYDMIGPATSDASVQAGERIDLAWFAAGGAVTEPAAFATADGPSPRLALAAGDQDVSVKLQWAGGEQAIDVPAGGSAGLDLMPGAIFVLSPTGPVSAMVSYAGDGRLAAYPVRPANPLATPLTIFR